MEILETSLCFNSQSYQVKYNSCFNPWIDKKCLILIRHFISTGKPSEHRSKTGAQSTYIAVTYICFHIWTLYLDLDLKTLQQDADISIWKRNDRRNIRLQWNEDLLVNNKISVTSQHRHTVMYCSVFDRTEIFTKFQLLDEVLNITHKQRGVFILICRQHIMVL